ncbi:MAG TPA: MOSC domain-containing protein [Nitrososphaerales archaeon]|nr:MOSC domain-containing protein [Nitrososphaerales archaeon]HUK75901.1 MOSC domain-containing protein [Nitrososphaerales archaeon]
MARSGVVDQLWRYPVVGLQGEPLKTAQIVEQGVVGDRAYHLRDTDGKIIGSIPRHSENGALNLRASTRDGAVVIESEGMSTSSDDRHFSQTLEAAIGVSVRLEANPKLATRAQNGRAIHLISRQSLRAMKESYPGGDFDVRRFRPNMVLSLADPQGSEERWTGRSLRVGTAVLRVEEPNDRCVVTTLPQLGLGADERILKTITEKNGGNLGVMCSVERMGVASVGDPVFLA